MGVSGCGKSSTAAALALAIGASMIEGDDHHLPGSQDKMRRGIPLDDEDRAPWLDRLGALVERSADHVVVTCSALKRSYRDRLRAAAPALRIVYLEIGADEALARVAARSGHWFPPSLVSNQFATLESPVGESGVLRVDATQEIILQCEAVLRWLGHLPSLPGKVHPLRRSLC
ncbi:gluconokinase [Variovorax sp. GB1R11]|uniref:gluconokinase n=1 Tax=Variovorax sp. GB1R11 TaxID=3443741 RepID=UPI003F482EDD